jgi:hypothetical protein
MKRGQTSIPSRGKFGAGILASTACFICRGRVIREAPFARQRPTVWQGDNPRQRDGAEGPSTAFQL